MIELSSSWELQGRRKLSEILFIKEVPLAEQCCDEDGSSDLAVDVSNEFASKPVILRPYLHPEVSSAGACCIMIRLSTQRLLRITQMVLISSSPHIDFVDRYGEPLARIEGVAVPGFENLFRCSSGRLSPHTECVVRFSEMHHTDPLVIQYIGVYTVCFTSPHSGFTESSESCTQEIIKLSSFLGSSPRQLTTSIRPDPRSQSLLSHLRPSKSNIAVPMSSMEPQRGKSASSPAAISAARDAAINSTDDSLCMLCGQFLSSLFGAHQPVEFWRKCATSLFASLVQLSVGEFASERRRQDFFHHLRNTLGVGADGQRNQELEEEEEGGQEPEQQQMQQQSSRSQGQLPSFSQANSSSASTNSEFFHPYPKSDDFIAFSICTLSANLNEIRQTTTAQLDEIFKRLACLEEGRRTDDPQQLSQPDQQSV